MKPRTPPNPDALALLQDIDALRNRLPLDPDQELRAEVLALSDKVLGYRCERYVVPFCQTAPREYLIEEREWILSILASAKERGLIA